ncbi:alpha/beta hydrolase [Natrinema sp. H-ect1]|uniref:alpha/beta hydrolase n=1 Tax=Natrinema sp. H-ect1 TaxID=3242700 RepID=UPI00359DCDF9
MKPIDDYVRGLESFRLLSHSTGGLIAEFLAGADRRVYLSPWGAFTGICGIRSSRSPCGSRCRGRSSRTAGPTGRCWGALATDRQLADTPSRVAPTFLREAKRAQSRLPPFQFEEAGVVFYTPTVPVVSTTAIERRTPESNRVVYEGGHQLFDSPSRETHVEPFLAALEDGPDALE